MDIKVKVENNILYKQCTYCEEFKILDDFHCSKRKLYFRQPWCKVCTSINDKERTDLGVKREERLKRLYNITVFEYEDLRIQYNNVCAICKKPPTAKSLSVDHNHITNEVRGLLCQNCNIALGLLNEDEDIIWNMLEYLKKYNWSKAS